MRLVKVFLVITMEDNVRKKGDFASAAQSGCKRPVNSIIPLLAGWLAVERRK